MCMCKELLALLISAQGWYKARMAMGIKMGGCIM